MDIFDIVDKNLPDPAAASSAAPPERLFDPEQFRRRPAPAIYAGLETGSEGIECETPPLDERSILSQCGFLRETLRSGGAQNDQGLWHLSVLAATFFKNGRAAA